MAMFIQLALIIAVLVSSTLSTPVVSIIRKGHLRPVQICYGVIVTEKYVLSTLFPLIAFPQKNILLLTGEHDFRYLTVKTKQQYAYNAKQITPAKNNVDLAVIETEAPIQFYLKINRVMILHKNDTVMLDRCSMIFPSRTSGMYNYRVKSKNHVTMRAMHVVYLKEKSDPAFLGLGTASEDTKVCMFDAGAPLFCRYALMGLLQYQQPQCLQLKLSPTECVRGEMMGFTTCNTTGNTDVFRFVFMNVYSPEATQLLDGFRDGSNYV